MPFIAQQENVASKLLIFYSEQGTDEALLDALHLVASRDVKSIMILACSVNNHSSEQLQTTLQHYSIPICGGIFPSVFFSNTKLDQGFIIVGFPFLISISCYELLSQSSVDFNAPYYLDGQAINHSHDLLVFIDAMANATEFFINSLYETIGGGINVIGGGAGSLDFVQRPCIFSRAGLLMNTALAVQLPVPIHCAVEHGWEILSGPYLVTEAENTKIKTLNYLPAFDVYKEVIEEITPYIFAMDNFFEVSQNFPFGILGINDELLVRDPIKVNGTELQCVGSVPVNSMVYILSGNSIRIISAAEHAGIIANGSSSFNSNDLLGLSIVFDCVSRALYLGDKFSQEMTAIQNGVGLQQAIVGALSIGEIANINGGTINLLNKSIVIGNI